MHRRFGAVIVLAALSVASAAWAHHNMSAAFNFDDRVTVSGLLTKVSWTNPHTNLFVDSKSGNTTGQSWSMEGPSRRFTAVV